MADRHLRRCPALLTTKKTPLKTTRRLLWRTHWKSQRQKDRWQTQKFLRRLNKQITIWFRNSISRCSCDRNHNICPANILSSDVHRRPEVENRKKMNFVRLPKTKTLPPCSIAAQQATTWPWQGGTLAATRINLENVQPTARSQSPKGGHIPPFIWNLQNKSEGDKGTGRELRRTGLFSEVKRIF